MDYVRGYSNQPRDAQRTSTHNPAPRYTNSIMPANEKPWAIMCRTRGTRVRIID